VRCGIVHGVTSSSHAAAIESATRRLLTIAALFGLTGSLVALVTAVTQLAAVGTVGLAVTWVSVWIAASIRPQLLIRLLRPRWTVTLVAAASTVTIVATGGFDSLLKTEANWLAWAAPIVLGTAASLRVAAILCSGLLVAFLLDGMSLPTIATGPDRYTAVTDILNPFIIVLAALAVTGVFRLVLTNAASTLRRAREGEGASSPAMSALIAAPPILALPAGEFDAVPTERSTPLSLAERDIIDRLARGETPQQIALARKVRDDTVYDQIGSAKRKAGAKTIEHLIVLAWHPPM